MNKETNINVIFTRHELTVEQKNNMVQGIVVDCTDIASKQISNIEEAYEIVSRILERVFSHLSGKDYTISIYGVIPVPIRFILVRKNEEFNLNKTISIKSYEAFNIQRSVEGQKPTFKFSGWLMTGLYTVK